MADIVIVGHGTSLVGSGLGATIDSYDCPIVRFAGFMQGCKIEDVGSRVDYLCTTTRQWKLIRWHGVFPSKEIWCYIHRNDFNFNELSFHNQHRHPLYIDYLGDWVHVYRGMVAEGKVLFFCKGLAAIIIAAKRFDISSILLFGFDNLWIGDSRGFETTGAGRVKGVYTSLHDYAAERKILDMVSDSYGVSISHIDMWDIKWAE